MPSPFATPNDVAARWRPLSAAELVVATTLCGDASALIRAQFPSIDNQIASGAIDVDVVTAVCANMVKRAMLGGADGISQESESEGPFAHSVSYANPLGNVFLTAAETTLILGYQPTALSSRFTNTTTNNETRGFGYYYNNG